MSRKTKSPAWWQIPRVIAGWVAGAAAVGVVAVFVATHISLPPKVEANQGAIKENEVELVKQSYDIASIGSALERTVNVQEKIAEQLQEQQMQMQMPQQMPPQKQYSQQLKGEKSQYYERSNHYQPREYPLEWMDEHGDWWCRYKDEDKWWECE